MSKLTLSEVMISDSYAKRKQAFIEWLEKEKEYLETETSKSDDYYAGMAIGIDRVMRKAKEML